LNLFAAGCKSHLGNICPTPWTEHGCAIEAEEYSPIQTADGPREGGRRVMCSIREFKNVSQPVVDVGGDTLGGEKMASISDVENTGDVRSYTR
jgi:hypothetical protein